MTDSRGRVLWSKSPDLDAMADMGLMDAGETRRYRMALDAGAAILDGDGADERRALGALAGETS